MGGYYAVPADPDPRVLFGTCRRVSSVSLVTSFGDFPNASFLVANRVRDIDTIVPDDQALARCAAPVKISRRERPRTPVDH